MDEYETHRETFECPEPRVGVSYRVLEDEWDLSGEKPVRVIKRVDLLGASVGR